MVDGAGADGRAAGAPTGPRPASDLASDCTRCVGLCCVALPFRRSADFPVDKAAGEPCRNLLADHACGIHDRLRAEGWVGCTVYECFGAGQRVTAAFGTGWRGAPSAPAMFAAFPVVQQAHEMLRHLAEATARADDDALRARAVELGVALEADVDALLTSAAERDGAGTPPEAARLDVAAWRARVGPVLVEVSAAVRAGALPEDAGSSAPGQGGRRVRDRAGRCGRPQDVPRGGPRGGRRVGPRPGPRADLVGAALAGADLRDADLRGALLLGADLRHADLRRADVLGADLRGADLAGADLRDALYLTQPQVDAARGDGRTRLGPGLRRPRHWGARAAVGP